MVKKYTAEIAVFHLQHIDSSGCVIEPSSTCSLAQCESPGQRPALVTRGQSDITGTLNWLGKVCLVWGLNCLEHLCCHVAVHIWKQLESELISIHSETPGMLDQKLLFIVDIWTGSKWHKVSTLQHHLNQWILLNRTCLWIQFGLKLAWGLQRCIETGMADFFCCRLSNCLCLCSTESFWRTGSLIRHSHPGLAPIGLPKESEGNAVV